jgi:anhydro-N-acetylmuramic acid kinase
MRVIGLISGTSVDGIDAALVDISGTTVDLRVDVVAGQTYPYPEALRTKILEVCAGQPVSIAELMRLDDAIAYHFAQAALQIQQDHAPAVLIGSHGQTVYHRPPDASPLADVTHQNWMQAVPLGCSVQLGRGETIAALTNLPTMSNFRAADMSAGGHGAPLVPPIDACLLSDRRYSRCIQNLGGIGNVAYLPATAPFSNGQSASYLQQVRGWDTGPGNALIDLAVYHYSDGQQTYDLNGAWAATGHVCEPLLDQWLSHPFFRQPPPKSTGREVFGLEFWHQVRTDSETYHLAPADVLATLTELTAASIALNYRLFLPQLPDQVLLCGGGSHNGYLRDRLQHHLAPIPVMTTQDVQFPADYKEAIAFAVLAYWRFHEIPGNLPDVTGARRAVLLGEAHLLL